MTSMNGILENRWLIRTRLGPPDVYHQDPKQKEDELTSVNVKQGFINQIPYLDENQEYGSAQRYSLDVNKINKSLNDILSLKQIKATYNDTAKKRPGLSKENFWLVLPKNRNHLLAWIKELRAGKVLNSLAKKVPICSRKEEVFQLLAENQITILRATWYIKMTAQYGVIQAEAKNKKNRITVDHNPDWTSLICKFMRDQLSRLLDDPTFNNSGMVLVHQSVEETEKQFEYMTKLANHLYLEGMLDRHDFLSWIVETMEKIRHHGTHALSYIMPLVLKHIQDIIKNQLLSRRLAFVISRLLNWLLNESTWGTVAPRSIAIESPSPLSVGPPSVSGQATQKQLSAPPTPSQAPKPKLGQASSISSIKPRTLPTNFPPSLEDIAYGLICILQCITVECPGALVWYPPDDPRTPGSPLDYLPTAPSLLPLPSITESSSTNNDTLTRARLHEVEADIVQRSYASEMRWSSDKCQESATGQTISRVLGTLEVLDKQQNFDRTDLVDPIYYDIFSHHSNKDGNDQLSQASEEAVICLLCEWAVSAQRLGEHRAAVVAKILDKRQMLLEQEQVNLVSERTRTLNSSSNPPTSSSNPGSVGTILSSPPPQLLVEGIEPPQIDQTQQQQQQVLMQSMVQNNTPMFQNLLFNFLDTQAPLLDNPSDKKELQAFKNLVMLFSELVQHDVFSHDEYVNTLISRGDITPGQISPLPIFTPSPGLNASLVPSLGYTNHSVGVVSVPSVGPTSVGAPVSNKPMDILMKNDPEDDLPSSVRSLDPKNDSDNLLFSPVMNPNFPQSPFDRAMSERHFTDVIKKLPDNAKDKSGSGYGGQIKRPVGPIWGYRQPRHVQFLMHFPIPFEDDDCVHESNQRMMVLYGAGRQRHEVKKEVKKISKYVCKLILKQSSTHATENSFHPSSVKSSSGGSSKKSKNRTMNDSSTPTYSFPSSNTLLKRFRCLTYFDQHFVTAQASKAILNCINDYLSDRSCVHLPPLSSITLVLNLMEESLNIGGMIRLCVQIANHLTSIEIEVNRKHLTDAGYYTKDLALNIVAILRHYQSYLTLDVDLTRQAFDAMFAFVSQSNANSNPGQCTSPDRCILVFLNDLYTSFHSKHLMDSQVSKFSSSASAIKRELFQNVYPATSNSVYDNSFMLDHLQNPTSSHPLLVAQEKYMMLRDQTYKYSFVCTTIITICTGPQTPESLSAIATLCAEMNAQCNTLSSEWLGVLMALFCGSSSTKANFTDVFLLVNPAEESIRDPLALFTAILIARNCLSMEGFIRDVAVKPLLTACTPGPHDADVETGARLSCHILLQLFKTPVSPSQVSADGSKPSFYIPEASDRHLLAACQRNIVVGAVIAVLKTLVKLADANFSGRHSSSPSNNDAGVASFLAPIGGLEEMNDPFGIPGLSRPQMNSGDSMETQSLSEFAKTAVRTICSQQWVREKCLKNIDLSIALFIDKSLTPGLLQHLIQLICCPEEDLQHLSDSPNDQQGYVLQVLHRMSRWTLRQTLLELKIMLKQAAQNERLADDIAKSVIEVFKNQNIEPTRDRKSPISGVELDKTNIWLMPPIITELSPEVQAKVLQEASRILETPQHLFGSKSDRDRLPGKNSASLLNQQPFLALILTCLKGQDRQREETLLDSLQSQILMFQSEWQEHRRDSSNLRDSGSNMSQSMVQEVLQLRLSLMGGMFDTVQNSTHFTSSVVLLLTQLISSGMVDIEVNAKLFNTVFDMIAVLLHGTLGGDFPNSGEWSKRDYSAIVKKIRKEISEIKARPSVKILRRLLPVPRKETYIIACDPGPHGDRHGLQIGSKQKVVPWDIIEGLKSFSPLCLSWYGAGRTERKELQYETQQRLMLFHDHDAWQQPLLHYLKPPVLPPEEEEKEEEIAKKNATKRKSIPSISKSKSPSGGGPSSFTHKDPSLHPQKRPKKDKPPIKKTKKVQDHSAHYNPRSMVPPNIYGGMGQTGMGSMQASSQTIRSSLPTFQNNASFTMPYQPSHHPSMPPNHAIMGGHNISKQVKNNLAHFVRARGNNIGGMMHSQPHQESSRNAIRSMVMQKGMGHRPRQATPMGPPPISNMRSMGNPHQQSQMTGYGNYGTSQAAGGGNMTPIHTMRNQNYYQGGVSNQQSSYHQTMPNQAYMSQQQQNPNMGQGYSMGNMPMAGGQMNQPSGYGMPGGMQVQNQTGMMGGQQPPQYPMMGQQTRTNNRMNLQHHMNATGTQGGMMQMQGMGGGQNTMNTAMGRQMQMVNQGMGSQYVPHQQQRAMPNQNMPNQGMYNNN